MRYRAAAFLLAFTTIPAPALSQGAASAQTAPTAPAPVSGQVRQTLTVTNYTGHTVVTLSVSPTGEGSGGQDILGGANLGNGESAQISFNRSEAQCVWDIKAIYDDGGTLDSPRVDVCQVASVALAVD
jgi:hypothetical protein